MRRRKIGPAIVLWAAVVAGGLGWVTVHAATAAPMAAAPARWPTSTTLPRAPDVPTLLLFAHPECPCTRASLHELEWILARAKGKVRATVVFAHPRNAPASWETSAIHATAQAIPGLEIVEDLGDEQAHAFDAHTSGNVVVYRPSGELAFAGGITVARGHEGANAARDAVLELLTGASFSERLLGRVFGCPLDTPPKER